MAKYTFIKDYTYQSCGIVCLPKVIKKNSTLSGSERTDGILISLNPNINIEESIKIPVIADMDESTVLVPKNYFNASYVTINDKDLLGNPIKAQFPEDNMNYKPQDQQALLKAQEEINKAQAKQINQMQKKSFFEEHKNHLLLIAGLVAGYLIYKKYKK
jgi:hypothetical protein